MRIPTVLTILLSVLGIYGSVQAQNYDRILTASDITFTAVPGGGGGGGGGGAGGGWLVRATAWLANASPVPIDLGCQLTLAINGVPIGTTALSVMVSNAGTGGSGCGTSCVTDGWCAACKQSIIVPGTCYCCNNSVSTELVVSSLSPGDVISAYITPLPGAAAEIATTNDSAFIVVPPPGGYNRVHKVHAVHYGRAASGEFAIAGEVTLQGNWDGIRRDLSTDVLVLVNGTPYGGGGGGSGGGGCGTALIIYMGSGSYLSGSNPPLFSCAEWCALCQHTNGNPNGNICLPPAPVDPSPFCFCDENCSQARIVPGRGWQVTVPQLGAGDQITVVISAHPGSLPELNTSDDAVIVSAGDAALCRSTFADMGQQGGVPGADGQFDNNDFIVFIDDFFTANPHADLGKQGGVFGSDGQFDNNDFIVFIDLFFAGPC